MNLLLRLSVGAFARAEFFLVLHSLVFVCGMFFVAYPLVLRFKYMRVQKYWTSLMPARGVVNENPMFVSNDMKARTLGT